MTHEQMIIDLLNLAYLNGYNPPVAHKHSDAEWTINRVTSSFIKFNWEWEGERWESQMDIATLLFSHDFAKKVFGADWSFHSMELAALPEDQRIKYAWENRSK